MEAATKRCPDCAEMVQAEAAKCRYCGYRWSGRDARPLLAHDPWRFAAVLLIAIFVLLAIVTCGG
ncbi:MAG: zinc ribbon domain-containing protein [Sphingopyxis sp.]